MNMNKVMVTCFIQYAVIVNVIVSSTKTYIVNEEEGKDSYIGNVPQDFALPPLSSNDVPRQYLIIKGKDLVRVDNTTGSLYTAVQLDREVLCPSNPRQCNVDVEVVVLPEVHFKSLKVQVRVEDLNDNVPRFLVNPMIRDISESASVGSPIRLDSAIDPDLGMNSIRRYQIASSPPSADDRNGTEVPFFRLDIISNIDGTQIPQLLLTNELDRETTSSYKLLLLAIDGGSRPQTGTATVQITVTDSNDNQPTFEASVYNFQVEENVKPGYVVARLTATDLDEGHNARIRYAFPNYVSEHDKSVFNLNSSNGILSVKSPGLDYENRTIHHLTVEARDGGPNSNAAYASVSVQVIDVNDEPPVIDINFANNAMDSREENTATDGQPKPVLIRENLDKGTFLAFVTVTDRDTGINGNVSCKLEDSSSFVMETLNEKENRYLIKTKAVLDRESKRYHNFEIKAWDFGRPSLSSTVTRDVELVDENDNDPSFVKDIYHLSVRENVPHETVIATLKAEDLDDGDNARVTYSAEPLDDGVDVPFTINPDTGDLIYVINAPPLDAENSTGPFRLRVIATDNGVPRRNTSTIVEISVADENDNAPRFYQKNYVFRIAENEKVGKFVGSVKANDSDIDKTTNGRVTYSFVEGGSPFNIDPIKGEISFIGKPSDLDREKRRSQPYVLTAQATDNADKPLFDQCTVEIYLLDINDNAPHISYPNVTRDVTFLYITAPQIRSRSKHSKRALKPENDTNTITNPGRSRNPKSQEKSHLKKSILIGSSKSGQIRQPTTVPVTLLKIVASDPDEGENGRVRYVLTRGNDKNYFAVDTHSGNVTLAIKDEKHLRQMERGCHIIEVDVKDLGKPILSSTTWINIYVTDAKPGSLNSSYIMKECMNNTYYPMQFLPPSKQAPGFEITWWMILIVVGVCLILIGLIVCLAVKCGCCGHSQSYSCKKEANSYGKTTYSRGSSANGKKGSTQRTGNGTLDSRTSFIDCTVSQKQLAAQEKGPSDQSDMSVDSRNSGKDSGTGDSMPSDAYHNAVGPRQPYMGQFYQNHIPDYGPTQQPSHVFLPPQDDVLTNTGDDSRRIGHVYPRCTDECRIHGHSDQCWMPEPKQRPSSRMTPLQTGEEYDGGSLKYRKRSMTPDFYQDNVDNPRYVAVAPSNTPFYYDPGSKFDDGSIHPPLSSFRDDQLELDTGNPPYAQMTSSNMAGAIPMHTFRQSGYQGHGQVAYAQSPIPYSAQSSALYMGPAQRGQPYLTGGGYDQDGVMVDESHSNLSSTGSANRFSNQGYPQPAYTQEQGYPISYRPGYRMDGYEEPRRNGPYEGVPQGYADGPPYEDDFAASNLLSPAYSETGDYKHALERQMKLYQQQNQTSTHPYQNSIEPEKNRKTSGNPPDSTNDQPDSLDDKLGTIREELDADEVIAEIDGLLL